MGIIDSAVIQNAMVFGGIEMGGLAVGLLGSLVVAAGGIVLSTGQPGHLLSAALASARRIMGIKVSPPQLCEVK